MRLGKLILEGKVKSSTVNGELKMKVLDGKESSLEFLIVNVNATHSILINCAN